MAIPPGAGYQTFTATSPKLERVLESPCAISLATATRAVSGALPKLHNFKAIWDTGATNSVISPAVVAACGLKPIGMTQVHTSNATCTAEQYLVDIYLPNKVVFQDVRVTNQQLSGAQILIGMDIIGMGDFAVTNKDRKTTFSYRWPSGERIDFVKHAPTVVTTGVPGRNSLCPCGSGKKFKRCCQGKV